jgi:hypothetical protein
MNTRVRMAESSAPFWGMVLFIFVSVAVSAFAQTPAPDGTRATSAEPREHPRGGITVHGHWVIEVHEADGALASRQEFENSLLDGDIFLPAFLRATYVVGIWRVDLMCGVDRCLVIDEATNTGAGPLVVERPTPTTVRLRGTVLSTAASAVTEVRSRNFDCLGLDASPLSCRSSSQRGLFDFSGTALPAPIPFTAGQFIQFSVTFSFS